MRNISNNKHYKISSSDLLLYLLGDSLFLELDKGDTIDFPITLPFKEDFYDVNLMYLNKLIKDGKIKIKDENVILSFSLYNSRPTNYADWELLLEYAKKHNIQFRLNEKFEYSPEEMKNYVEQFTIIDGNGERKLTFDSKNFKLKDNPLVSKDSESSFIFDIFDISLILNSQINKTIDEYLLDESKTMIVFCLNDYKKFDLQHLKYARQAIEHLKKTYPSRDIDISIYTRYQYFDSEEFKNLLKLEKYIKSNYKKDYELKFHSGGNITNKTQILNANSKISKVVEYLKKSSLSPYEKVLYVHKLLSENSFYQNRGIDQDIYSLLNSRGMVCISYAMIFNAIFTELDDPNIKTRIQIFNDDSSVSNNGKEYHGLNNVYIKDKKYSIEGYYDLDITVNAGSNLLNNFMIPSGDVMKITSNTKRELVPYGEIKFVKRAMYFLKRDLDNIMSLDLDVSDEIIDNTLEYLNTSMGKLALTKARKSKTNNTLDYLLSAINECVEHTNSISIEVTKEALKNITKTCYGMNEYESKEYISNVINETIFDSILICDRAKCKNSFSRMSLEIENGKYSKIKAKSTRKI